MKAVILERKLVYGMTERELASAGQVNYSYMRRLMSSVHTKDWNPDVRRLVCQKLGIDIHTILKFQNIDGSVTIK